MIKTKLKSTQEYVIDSGMRKHGSYYGVFVNTPRKNSNRPQNHIQWVHKKNLIEEKY